MLSKIIKWFQSLGKKPGADPEWWAAHGDTTMPQIDERVLEAYAAERTRPYAELQCAQGFKVAVNFRPGDTRFGHDDGQHKAYHGDGTRCFLNTCSADKTVREAELVKVCAYKSLKQGGQDA
jgi:hypothetical protein